MEDIIKISNLELESLKNNYSNILSDTSNASDDDKEIESRYALQMKKTLWSINNEAKANKIITNVNNAIYKIENIDYINYCYIDVVLPKITVRDDYKDIKVSWCEKVGISMIKEAKLFIADKLIQILNNKTINLLSVLEISNSDKYVFDKLLGNEASLTEKDTIKEKFHLRVPQLWFFGKKRGISFPKYLINGDISFQYEFYPISKLIKLYKEDKNGTYEIEYDDKYIEVTQYDIPDLYYRFSQVTQEEKDWVKEKKFQILIQEVILHETKIEPPINKFKFKFNDNGLCQGIIWTIQDNDDNVLNNHFTYLKSDDLNYDVTIIIGDHGKLISKDNKYFSLLNQWFTCNGFSNEDTYNVFPFTNKIFLKAIMDSGINLRDLKVKFNADIKQKPEKQYTVEFYVIISKILEMEYGKLKIIV